MTELVDPQLLAWEQADPSILQEPAPLPQIAPLISRHDVERDLSVAIVVMAGLVVRDVLMHRGTEDEDLADIAQGSWRRHLPMWLQLSAPAVKHAYGLGRVAGLTEDELNALAETYASELGDYVNESSARAVQEGLQLQLNQRWSYRVARERATMGYGLDSVSMRTYLGSAMKEGETSTQVIPEASRHLVTRLLLKRADRIGKDEAYSAEQMGQAMSWMYLYQQGRLPGAMREWELGGSEEHCGACSALAGQRVAPDEPFLLQGMQIWAPRAHPGCACRLRLTQGIAKVGVSVAGVMLVAKDTGRVLMLQRANDPKDPAGGCWEVPGGHLEDGESPEAGAIREWQEEVRQKLPSDVRHISSWHSGIYEGFVLMTESEDAVQPHRRGRFANPDDPDGDEIEAIAWWDIDHIAGNRGVRPELRAALPKIRKAYSESLHAIRKAFEGDPRDRDAHGRFATFEGRHSRTQVLDRPMDSELGGLIEQVKPVPLGSGVRLGQPRTSLGSSSATLGSQATLGARATLGAPVALGAPTTLGQMAEQKKAQRKTQSTRIRITLKLPELKPKPETAWAYDSPTRSGHFIAYGDLDDYYAEEWGGVVGGYGSPVDFGHIAQWYDENGHENDTAHFIPSTFEPSSWDAVPPQAEGYTDKEWNEVMDAAMPTWQAARENAVEIVEDLDDSELRDIAGKSFLGEQHPAAFMRQEILNSIDGTSEYGPGIGDAYADYITWSRPDRTDSYLGDRQPWEPTWDQMLSALPDREELEGNTPLALRIVRFADGENSDDLRRSYDIMDGHYISALAERDAGNDTPNGYVAMTTMDLGPE